jgi:Arc/MetJ family transcription regulator
MATNLALDNNLIDKAKKLGKHRTKREAVNAALAEYVRRRQPKRILSLFGKVDYLPGFDHRQLRGR